MKWSFATIGVILLGIIGVAAILLFQELTTGSENDYYLLKEATEAAMIDAIDLKTYRETGELKIVKEKFIENFTRRYAESTLFIGTSYTISFFDIMEEPPKVTILMETGLENYRIYSTTGNYNVQNNLTGILEFVNSKTFTASSENELYTKGKMLNKTYYSMPLVNRGSVEVTQPINYPEELKGRNVKNLAITLKSAQSTNNLGDIMTAKLKKGIDWTRSTKQEEGYETDYLDEIDVSKFATSCNEITSLEYYNCETKEGNWLGTSPSYNCEKYNNIWIHYKTENCNNDNVVIKLDTTWTYDEYEYNK